ncbi:Uncharacterised protein [Streptococcus pneumoniae]|nr:Uncharacterised protein [Streptococcus pneumoniae]
MCASYRWHCWFGYNRMRNINSRTVWEVNHSDFGLIIRISYAISHASWKLGILTICFLDFLFKACFGCCCKVTITNRCIIINHLVIIRWIKNLITINISISFYYDISCNRLRLCICRVIRRQDKSVITWINTSLSISPY